MISIFDYDDFRTYLADWYREKKSENSKLSYQQLAEKAGIRNKGFLYNIIKGKKLLAGSNIFKVSRALGLNRREADYFENLVTLNQSKDPGERKHVCEKLLQFRDTGKQSASTLVLRKDQYDFYSNWYHVAIRSIIGMYEFTDNYRWLASMLNPPITVTQARHSVQLLEKLELISKDDNGVYRIGSKSITTGKDIVDVAVQNFHRSCNELAMRAQTVFPRNIRNISGLTLGISAASYRRISEEIVFFQRKIMELANTDDDADQVYQFDFRFYPLSDRNSQGKKVCE